MAPQGGYELCAQALSVRSLTRLRRMSRLTETQILIRMSAQTCMGYQKYRNMISETHKYSLLIGFSHVGALDAAFGCEPVGGESVGNGKFITLCTSASHLSLDLELERKGDTEGRFASQPMFC